MFQYGWKGTIIRRCVEKTCMGFAKNITSSDYATVSPSQKKSPRKYGGPKRDFNCKMCNGRFRSNYELQKHKIYIHDEKQCEKCPFKSSSHGLLIEHNLNKHGTPGNNSKLKSQLVLEAEQRYQREAAKRDTELASKPKTRIEKKIPFICKMCDEGFDTNYSLYEHVIYNHEDKHCQRCPYKASRIHFLVEHHLNKHSLPGSSRNMEISKLMQEVKKTCQQEAAKREKGLGLQQKLQNDVVIGDLGNLKEGVGQTDKIPKTVVLYKCNWCPTAFYKAEDRTIHVNRMHPGKEEENVGQADYTCKECGQTFPTDEMLLNHHLSAHEERNDEIEDYIIEEGLLNFLN